MLPYLLWFVAAPSDFAGAAACSNCHPAEFRSQSAGAHALALARSRPPQPGDWAFGAGMQAITFVTRLESEHYLEEGRTWYRALDGYARTPGHKNSAGVRDRIFDPSAAILRCFACHSTGPLRFSADQGIIPFELGVRCEACHGPATAHVQDPKRVRPNNPGRLTAGELNRLCGDCHRMPAAAGETASLLNPWNARHQPLMLAASACFRESQGRLSCLTCHLPHAPLERDLPAYEVACAQCHRAPRHKTLTAGRSCVECHMPAVQPEPHLRFANHRIAVYSRARPMAPIRRPGARSPE